MAIDIKCIKITPPNLDDDHLGQKIICHRPMRAKTPNLMVEKLKQENKIILHHYGHGGSGWTLAPASAEYVVKLLENSVHASDLGKQTPITIIGAGVIGLFTAYKLQQFGYQNITLVADSFDNLTSHNAGGLIAPVSMNNEFSKQAIIETISIEAYKFFARIADKSHPHFKTGAFFIPTYLANAHNSPLAPYVKHQVMKPPTDVILDFGNGTQRRMIAHSDGIFIDTVKMINELTAYLKIFVKFRRQKINNFSQIKSKYIINCTGLGSKILVPHDENLVSVQGHMVALKDQFMDDLQYIILAYCDDEFVNRYGQKVKRSFYLFPKPVIGGTFISEASLDTPNDEEFAILIDNARKFFGMIK